LSEALLPQFAPLVGKLDGAAIPVNPGAHTFRFQWRDGTSGVAQQVMHDLKAVLIAEVQRDLPKLIVHPTAKTVKIEEPK